MVTAPPYPAFDGSQLCTQADPEIFHPARSERALDAKAVCTGCPWLEECREWAIWHDVEGIWGGTSHQWRQRQRQRRKLPSTYSGRTAQIRALILAAGPSVLSKDLARALGVNEKTIQRHRKAVA